MADILIQDNCPIGVPGSQTLKTERIYKSPNSICDILGQEGTFCVVRDGEDVIASIGYVCRVDGESMRKTLSEILNSFQESDITRLKKELLGQYVLVIKKKQTVYLFSDFTGTRNIFYSEDGRFASSSFAQIEDLAQTTSGDLDSYKLLEFLALRHVFYPTWIGRSTYHKRIKWLRPYEYLVLEAEKGGLRVRSVVYSFDNFKRTDCDALGKELLSLLRPLVNRKEFKEAKVGSTLTGGHDSRLVSVLAADYYPQIHFRLAAGSFDPDSEKDLLVAEKIGRLLRVPVDAFRFERDRDEERFAELTEGFSPAYNQTIAPLLDGSGCYALGLGGSFGTESFLPIPWPSIDNFVQVKIDGMRSSFQVGDEFWKPFRQSLYEELQSTKEHFQLSTPDDTDYIRFFCLLVTARYGSFMLSALNRSGFQLDPYGSHRILEFALHVSPLLWGNHRTFAGAGWVQKAAMQALDPRVGRVRTYMHFRPMLPLSASTCLDYLAGYVLQISNWMRAKWKRGGMALIRTEVPGGYYISNNWEKYFLGRTAKKYSLGFKSSALAN